MGNNPFTSKEYWKEEIKKDGLSFLELEDGRILEYFYQDVDSKAPIILLFGGSSSTSWSTKEVYQKKKNSKNVNILRITIPGFGGSTKKEGRLLEDFHKDVKPVFEKLKISPEREIYVFGISHGGIHALEVAASGLFNVKKLALIVPSAPTVLTETVTQDALDNNGKFKFLQNYVIVPLMKHFPNIAFSKVDFGKDREIHLQDVKRSFKFDDSGWIAHYEMIRRGFNFPFDELKKKELKEKTFFVMGKQDKIVPKECLEYYLKTAYDEENIENPSVKVFWEDGDHFLCFRNYEEHLDRLMNF